LQAIAALLRSAYAKQAQPSGACGGCAGQFGDAPAAFPGFAGAKRAATACAARGGREMELVPLVIYGNLVVWGLAILAGWMAHRKGRDWLVFGLSELLLPVLGLIVCYSANPAREKRGWNAGTAVALAAFVFGSILLTTAPLLSNTALLLVGAVSEFALGPMVLALALRPRVEEPPEPVFPLDRAKVLVVDDDPDAVEFVRAVLEEEGCRVVSAADGEEGIRKAEAEMPDAVVLDLMMPGKGGFETFAEMRRSPNLWNIPVVILTGVRRTTGIPFTSEAIRRGVGQEPEVFVEKPFRPTDLAEAVGRAIWAQDLEEDLSQPLPRPRRRARPLSSSWAAHLGCAAMCIAAVLLVLGVPLAFLVKEGYIGARYLARRRAFAEGKPYFTCVDEEAQVVYEPLPLEADILEHPEMVSLPQVLPLIPIRYEVNPSCPSEPFAVRLHTTVTGYPDEGLSGGLETEHGAVLWQIGPADPLTGRQTVETICHPRPGRTFAAFVPIGRGEEGDHKAIVEFVRQEDSGEWALLSNRWSLVVGVNNELRRVGVFSSEKSSPGYWTERMGR
jgi:CheY-like chemotaxis protein